MSHTKGKVVLDHSIRTAINMAAPPYQHIAMVNITQNKNYTITKEEHDDNARRIAALWNMAELLGLTTDEINAKESLFRAAPDMLRALEAVCGDSEESDYLMQAQIQAMCRSAIRKARGEE